MQIDDLQELSCSELKKLDEKIQQLLHEKKDQKQKELWDAVVQAISNYNREVDCIAVTTPSRITTYIDCENSLAFPGIIMTDWEEQT